LFFLEVYKLFKMKIKISLIILFLLFTISVPAKEYAVSLKGNDINKGSKDSTFRSIFKASETAMPGDTITILAGEYKLSEQFRPFRSGLPGKWILYRAAPGQLVIFEGSLIKKVLQGNDSVRFSRQTQGIFQIEKVDYLRFENIEVRNSDAAGFIVRGPECKKIELTGCKSHQTHNSGIGLWYCDSVIVSHCEITTIHLVSEKEEKLLMKLFPYAGPSFLRLRIIMSIIASKKVSTVKK